MNIKITSGSQDRGETSSTSPLPGRGGVSGACAAASSSEQAAASTSRKTSTASGSAGVRAPSESPKEIAPANPWTKFQHEHRGKGLSKRTMANLSTIGIFVREKSRGGFLMVSREAKKTTGTSKR